MRDLDFWRPGGTHRSVWRAKSRFAWKSGTPISRSQEIPVFFHLSARESGEASGIARNGGFRRLSNVCVAIAVTGAYLDDGQGLRLTGAARFS